MASNCPFRANANRSLVRLLQDRKLNVKKLYTSKAKMLSLNLETQRLPMPTFTAKSEWALGSLPLLQPERDKPQPQAASSMACCLDENGG